MKKDEHLPIVFSIVNLERGHNVTFILGDDECTITTVCSPDLTITKRERGMTYTDAMDLASKYVKLAGQPELVVSKRLELNDAILSLSSIVLGLPYLDYKDPIQIRGWNNKSVQIYVHRVSEEAGVDIEIQSIDGKIYLPLDEFFDIEEYIARVFNEKEEKQ